TENTKIARLDNPSGRLLALSDGKTTIRAHLAGKSVQTGVWVDKSEAEIPFSFARNIGRILTKSGCNSSGCHGGVKGRGGFRLSLDALHPRDDYRWIVEGGGYQVLTAEVREPKTPRINVKQPEDSLLLLKPTAKLPHGGGARLK